MTERICKICGTERNAEDFFGKRGRICKKCRKKRANASAQRRRDNMTDEERAAANKKHRENGKAWRERNPKEYKAYHKSRHDRGRAFIQMFLTKCVRCGENDPVTLEFHHRVPRKGGGEGVSSMSHRTLEIIKAEIDRCDVLCANCHTKVHYFIDEDGKRKMR